MTSTWAGPTSTALEKPSELVRCLLEFTAE